MKVELRGQARGHNRSCELGTGTTHSAGGSLLTRLLKQRTQVAPGQPRCSPARFLSPLSRKHTAPSLLTPVALLRFLSPWSCPGLCRCLVIPLPPPLPPPALEASLRASGADQGCRLGGGPVGTRLADIPCPVSCATGRGATSSLKSCLRPCPPDHSRGINDCGLIHNSLPSSVPLSLPSARLLRPTARITRTAPSPVLPSAGSPRAPCHPQHVLHTNVQARPTFHKQTLNSVLGPHCPPSHVPTIPSHSALKASFWSRALGLCPGTIPVSCPSTPTPSQVLKTPLPGPWLSPSPPKTSLGFLLVGTPLPCSPDCKFLELTVRMSPQPWSRQPHGAGFGRRIRLRGCPQCSHPGPVNIPPLTRPGRTTSGKHFPVFEGLFLILSAPFRNEGLPLCRTNPRPSPRISVLCISGWEWLRATSPTWGQSQWQDAPTPTHLVCRGWAEWAMPAGTRGQQAEAGGLGGRLGS